MIAESTSRGRGLAAQALAGALLYVEHLFRHNVTGVVAKISLDNELSLRFFEKKLGFVVRKKNTCFNEVRSNFLLKYMYSHRLNWCALFRTPPNLRLFKLPRRLLTWWQVRERRGYFACMKLVNFDHACLLQSENKFPFILSFLL